MHINTTYKDIKDLNLIKNDILKPIHLYAQQICPKPINIDKIYTQGLYAEMMSLFSNFEKTSVSLVSRAATQSFIRLNPFDKDAPENCYNTLFAFYVPWFIDLNKNILIKQNEKSDFILKENVYVNFYEKYKEPREKLKETWIPFYVKKQEKMLKQDYFIFNKNSPIYDMVIL